MTETNETGVEIEKTVPVVKTSEEKKEKHKEAQGKKATTKKKIRHYTLDETKAEIKRLEKTGHQLSVYYHQVHQHLADLTATPELA